MVPPGRLPRTPKIQNTGEAQPCPPILQAMPEVQAAAVAAGDNFQIRNGCNSREIQGAGIEHPESSIRHQIGHLLFTTYYRLITFSCMSVESVTIVIFTPSQTGRSPRSNDMRCRSLQFCVFVPYYSSKFFNYFIPFCFYGG